MSTKGWVVSHKKVIDKRLLLPVLFACLVSIVLIPGLPALNEIPSRDSGVFLYVGAQILDGKIPYRDVWDHKPPVIYYLNALGLLIGAGSRWGVWLLRFVSLSAAVLIGYQLKKQAFGAAAALFASLAWVASLVVFLGAGNYAEEYALPFQFLALYTFYRAEQRNYRSWHGYGIGAALAIAALMKPTTLGILIAIIIYTFIHSIYSGRWEKLVRSFTAIAIGSGAIFLGVALYFASQNAFGYLIDSVLRYNLAYSQSVTLADRLVTVLEGARLLASSGLMVFGLVAWLIAVLSLAAREERIKPLRPLLYVLVLTIPIDFLLTASMGRPYLHYYISHIPVFAALTGFFAHVLAANPPAQANRFFNHLRLKPSAVWLSIFLLVIVSLSAATFLREVILHRQTNTNTRQQAVAYIRNHTGEGDYILLWGAETALHYLTRRPAPSRFVYQYPLYTPGYQSPELAAEFLHDITLHKPALIIDTSPGNPFIPPLDAAQRQQWLAERENSARQWYQPLDMQELFTYLAANYEFQETLGSQGWAVYAYKGSR